MPWNVYPLFMMLSVIFSIIAVVPVLTSHSRYLKSDIFESWGSTEIKVTRLRYTWTIENLRFCCQKGDEVLISPKFSDETNDGCDWDLRIIYPEHVSHSHNKNYISFYIGYLLKCDAKADFKFGIVNAKGIEVNVFNNTFLFHKYDRWSIPVNFVEQDFLFDETKELMVDNKLTIFCEINATIGSENFSKKYNPSLPKSHLKKDLGFLLENNDFSDVKLSTGGIEFKALKAILAARSPVFRAMFELDNSNSISIIEMKDMDPQVVKELLRYIYTDEPSNLEDYAPDLLAAAEKYKLNGLRTICENVMSANLTVENAAKFYILGDTYSALELKFQAKDFIAAHVSGVTRTSAFKSLIKTHPHLVEEVFDAFS